MSVMLLPDRKFPLRGGVPVLVSREEFEECCCPEPPSCTCPEDLPDVIMVYFLKSSAEYFNDDCTNIFSGTGVRTKNNEPVALTRVGTSCLWVAEDPEEDFVESNLVEFGIPEAEPWDAFEEPVTLELWLTCIDAENDIGKWVFAATGITLDEGWNKLLGATPFGVWSNVETCNLLNDPGDGSIKNWDIMEVT